MNRVESTGRPPAADTHEERLRREIAYYKARIADMRNAPPHSRHREGVVWASTQLREAEEQLAALLERERHERRH